jgi:hypothetical protein
MTDNALIDLLAALSLVAVPPVIMYPPAALHWIAPPDPDNDLPLFVGGVDDDGVPYQGLY